MRCVLPDRMPFALCVLLAFTLQSGLAPAQKPMSPEDEALYRSMIKGAGIDPDAGEGGQEKHRILALE